MYKRRYLGRRTEKEIEQDVMRAIATIISEKGISSVTIKEVSNLSKTDVIVLERRFKNDEDEEVQPVFVPVALFTTSIARHFIISNAQANYDNFLYADTDSLHLFHSDNLVLDIDPNEFGKWAHEGRAKKGKYLRSKLYLEEIINEDGTSFLDVKGAGMTDEIKKKVTFENFVIGATFEGKRASKQIKGGTLIYETTFKIRETDYLI